MSRKLGPACKLCRRQREKLFLKGERCLTAKCAIERRNTPPGPVALMVRKLSEYGRRLREKQKFRFFYGITERQMQIAFDQASRKKGVTGVNLIVGCEFRLDNLLVRSGVTKSRKRARQSIVHRRVFVNGKLVTAPRFQVRLGDAITTTDKLLKGALDQLKVEEMPSWLTKENGSLVVVRLPDRTEIDVPVDEQLIIEYYR